MTKEERDAVQARCVSIDNIIIGIERELRMLRTHLDILTKVCEDEPQMGDAKPIPLSNRVTHIKDEPQTVRSNLEPFRVDEPQTEMTTEQIVNELLSLKKILDDGKLPKQTHEIRTNTHECVKDTHDKTEPQTERRCGNCKHLTYRWNKTWCDIKCDNLHDMACDKWERSE